MAKLSFCRGKSGNIAVGAGVFAQIGDGVATGAKQFRKIAAGETVLPSVDDAVHHYDIDLRRLRGMGERAADVALADVDVVLGQFADAEIHGDDRAARQNGSADAWAWAERMTCDTLAAQRACRQHASVAIPGWITPRVDGCRLDGGAIAPRTLPSANHAPTSIA